MAKSKVREYVLWGRHGPTTDGNLVKIMGGTHAECERELHRRASAGWTDLKIRVHSKFGHEFNIPLDQLQLDQPLEDDEDALLGVCVMGGVHFHVQAVKVVRGEDGVLTATKDPYRRLDGFERLDECSFTTVQIPGQDGDWVIVIHPFCE